jgi:hypothetical protein
VATKIQGESWFSLDLGAARKVSKLAVMNQFSEGWCQNDNQSNLANCCARGKGVTIYVGDTAGAPDTTNDKVCASAIDFRCASGLHDIPCTGGVHTGRYVKIWRNDKLSICEARVYGPVEDGASPSSIIKYHKRSLNTVCRPRVLLAFEKGGEMRNI